MSRRSKSFINTRTGIVIVGEGITEQYYFLHLKKLKGFHCTVEPRMQRNTSISSLEKKIKEHVQNDIHVICVFDADVAGADPSVRKKLNDFKKKYGKHRNVTLCDSLPTIEYWFLLHFSARKTTACTSASVIKRLKRHIENYEKTKKFLKNPKWVEEMTDGSGNLQNAIHKAKKEACAERPVHCPYTNVYKAILLLQAGKP